MKGQGTIVATGAIGYPPGLAAVGADDRRREGDDDDVDVRPSHHPGRRVGPVPPGRRGLPAGRARLLRAGLRRPRRDARRRARSRRRPPAAAAAQRDAAGDARAGASRVAPDEALLQAVQAATSLLKAHRMHGHLAAKLDPLGSEPEGDPALDPETVGLTPELMARIPAQDPAHATCRARRSPTRCRTCARPTAARSPTRSSTSRRTASARGCARRSSRAPTARR